jgi:hypothetical protein
MLVEHDLRTPVIPRHQFVPQVPDFSKSVSANPGRFSSVLTIIKKRFPKTKVAEQHYRNRLGGRAIFSVAPGYGIRVMAARSPTENAWVASYGKLITNPFGGGLPNADDYHVEAIINARGGSPSKAVKNLLGMIRKEQIKLLCMRKSHV